MASNNSRNPEDLSFARSIGEELGSSLDRKHALGFRSKPANADQILHSVLRRIDDKFGYGRLSDKSLADSAIQEFTRDIYDAIQIISFSRQNKLDGVPVFSQSLVHNDFDIPPLFDVFSGQARESVIGSVSEVGVEKMGVLLGQPLLGGLDFRSVKLLPLREACTGFMTLFSDSLRSAVRIFRAQNTSYVRYTVHSTGSGYQLEYWPQYKYSPIVFGNGLTTPLDHTVKIGYYHFQGWRNGNVIRDGGVYFASPQNISTHLRDF